ncbi:MAG: AbrB/MazE/SpoVT family DNA-binding domain-containing protein [Pseudomonadota bacterium]|nr:AbrB/MazE/SpoVT family DNA-binding domain-containing protein [Pseudomonadota bacterium]
MKMQIGRWGNSLAVRLPKALVERLGLREGDEIDLSPLEAATEDMARRRREEAIEEIKARAWIPEGFKFSREEFYDEVMRERLPGFWP